MITAHRVVYEAHVYFDADGSGRYADATPATARASGGSPPRCQTTCADLLRAAGEGRSTAARGLLTRVRGLVHRIALPGPSRRSVS